MRKEIMGRRNNIVALYKLRLKNELKRMQTPEKQRDLAALVPRIQSEWDEVNTVLAEVNRICPEKSFGYVA